MISKIHQSRHFEPFTTAQGSCTFPTVGKTRGARGGDISGGHCYNPRKLDLFRDLEEKLLQQETRNSPSEVATLLQPDFFEFGQSGTVWNRQQIIDRLARERPMEGSLTDLPVRSLAADVMLVTYRAVGRDPASGKEWHSLRSSVWKLSHSRWQMILHQGTPARDPSP
jgi:hypothetical protein